MKFSMIAITFGLIGTMAFAARPHEFNQASYEQSQAQGKVTVIGFHAKGCGSCKVQKPILDALLKTQELAPIEGYFADYDKEKSFRKKLKVPYPSTIVLIKDNREVARLTGETDEAKIHAFLKQGLAL